MPEFLDRRNKKRRERIILDSFIEKQGLGVTSIIEREAPDFVLDTEGRKISLELTEIVDPRRRAQEVLQAQIVEEAKEKFNAKYKTRLRVYVTFTNAGINCKKGEVGKYAQILFSRVEDIYLANCKSIFRVKSLPKYPPMDGVESMIVSTEPGYCNWQPFSGFVVPRIDFNLLDSAIKSKEKNLVKYAYEFTANWLLLCTNFGTLSTANDFVFIDQYKIETRFDRVFSFSYREQEIFQLK